MYLLYTLQKQIGCFNQSGYSGCSQSQTVVQEVLWYYRLIVHKATRGICLDYLMAMRDSADSNQ